MKKRILAQIVLGFLLAFTLSEAALRLVGFTHLNNNTLDRNNLIIFKPNTSFVNKGACFTALVTTNSFGFHSKEYSLQKPANTYRIVVLGDSFVEAVQVPLAETFTTRLESMLNASATGTLRYEVIPIAKSGHGTLANLLFARTYALQFHPDLIIDAFTSNDLTDDFADKDTLHAKPAGDQYDPESLYVQGETGVKKHLLLLKHSILEHSMLLEHWWMNMLIVKAGLQDADASLNDKEEGSSSMLSTALLEPAGETAAVLWNSEEKALATLNTFAKNHGVKFAVVQLTERFIYDANTRLSWTNNQTLLDAFDPKGLAKELSRRAEKQGIVFFSTEDALVGQFTKTHESPNLICDNHYSSRGHEWVAEAVYGFLKKNPGLITR